MEELVKFVMEHAIRGACTCGKCSDAPANPEQLQPETPKAPNHTADMIFFKVAAKPNTDADVLRTLIKENKAGAFCDCDLFDGNEHNYIELGGWIGDQGLALQLMGLGTVLGLWNLLSPLTMLPGMNLPEHVIKAMAGQGMLAIQYAAAQPGKTEPTPAPQSHDQGNATAQQKP